jgi:hypothetical protein
VSRSFESEIGIDLGDIWSHYCTLNEDGEVIDRGRFRTTPKELRSGFQFTASSCGHGGGNHSIWVSEQLREPGHEVIVAKSPQ